MSHYSVLIIGKNPEIQLFPYEELNLPFDELATDPRAEFLTEVPAGQFEEKARAIIAGLATDHPELAADYRQLLAEGRVEDLLQSWFGGQQNDAGDWGRYCNPEAKWDWFSFGGRWAGKLVLKPGRTGVLSPESKDDAVRFPPREVDQARFGDIDWAKTRQNFSPFAVLRRGQWHELGRMGWFGITLDPKPDEAWEDEISRLLEGVPEGEIVSVFDCHI